MELVNKRDMADAAAFIDEYNIDPELIHDLAQAIADGRRPVPVPNPALRSRATSERGR